MAICDASYCATLFNSGQCHSNNDSDILANSVMGKMSDDDQLNVPADCKLSEHHEQVLPYFSLGDEIFSSKKWLVRSYSGKKANKEERICNYRHSR